MVLKYYNKQNEKSYNEINHNVLDFNDYIKKDTFKKETDIYKFEFRPHISFSIFVQDK